MPQHIIVVEYRPEWAQEYASEERKIREILGDNCAAIYHIGSTSVPGLAAKPIIDIMPVVKSLPLVDGKAAEFEKIGYEYLGEFGIPGRRLPVHARRGAGRIRPAEKIAGGKIPLRHRRILRRQGCLCQGSGEESPCTVSHAEIELNHENFAETACRFYQEILKKEP